MRIVYVAVYFSLGELLFTWCEGVITHITCDEIVGKRRHWRNERECLKIEECVADKIQEQKGEYFKMPTKCLKKYAFRNREKSVYKTPRICIKRKERKFKKLMIVLKKQARVICSSHHLLRASKTRKYVNKDSKTSHHLLRASKTRKYVDGKRNVSLTTVTPTIISSVRPITSPSVVSRDNTKPDVNLEEKEEIHKDSKNLSYLWLIAVGMFILSSITGMIFLCRKKISKKTRLNLTEMCSSVHMTEYDTNLRKDDDLNSVYTENTPVSMETEYTPVSIETEYTELDINSRNVYCNTQYVSSAKSSFKSHCSLFPITRYVSLPDPADAYNYPLDPEDDYSYPLVPANAYSYPSDPVDAYSYPSDPADAYNYPSDPADTNIRMENTSFAGDLNSCFPENVQNVYCNTKNVSSAESSYQSNCSHFSIASYVALPDTTYTNNHLRETADAKNHIHLPYTADANNHLPETADAKNHIHLPYTMDTNNVEKDINIYSRFNLIQYKYLKDINIGQKNFFDNYHREEATQTKITNYPKTLLDTDWECESVFSQVGGQLQAENSSVKLIVPCETVEASSTIRIFGQTHVNLQRVREKLDIPAEEYIVSPAAEYHMDANWKEVIRKHMVIILPHTLPPGFDQRQLVIYGFDMVNGRSTKYKIPEKCKENEIDPDIYYEIDDKYQNVRVFTRHFSGVIMCYHCGNAIKCPGFLQARIYGSNLIKGKTREVQIRYEIWDDKHKIKDFHKSDEYNCGINKELTFLESKRLTLPSTVDAETSITMKLQMTGNEWDMWGCKKYQGIQGDIYPIEKNISIQQLIVCCHDKPFVANWVMSWKHQECPKELFECVITLTDNTTPTSSEPLNEPAYISQIPCSNLSHEVWNKQHSKAVDILKATLNRTQVEQICCRCDILRNQVSDIQLDQRNLSEDEFMYKWLDVLSDKFSTEFPNDILKHLRDIKADTAITAMREKGLIKNESMDEVSEELAGPQAMEEYRRDDMQRRSPCEYSDDGEYEIYDPDNKDETEVKVLETQV